jgi:DNA-binding NarL/FixJ family response regulator
MPRNVVYLVDEVPRELAANRRMLELLLEDADVRIEELPPLERLSHYNKLLAKPETAAFIIDQRLWTSGEVVGYSGMRLASHLRGINPKLPIYILTNYSTDPDLHGANEQTVEGIIPKDELRKQDAALRFKARFLRRLVVFRDVLSQREARFHALLTKSLRQRLTTAEKKELNVLQETRLAPLQAAELEDIAALGKNIEALKKLIRATQTRK